MPGSNCGLAHPEHPAIRCDQRGSHPLCSGFDTTDPFAEYMDWPNPGYVPPVKVSRVAVKSHLAAVAAQVPPAPPKPVRDGFPAGLEGSERAGEAWDEAQKKLVDDAIAAVARAHAGGGEFTSDEIWEHLAGAVPVTKGLTARLMMAKRRGLLDSTGKTGISERGGHHDHGQRLTLWYSLLTR